MAGPNREIIPDVWPKRTRPESVTGGLAVAEIDTPVKVEVVPQEVHESYVEILDRQTGQQVVTVIEVVSPTNKFAGAGRDSYVAKQREVLNSQAHLVEIDLLRAGQHVLAVAEWAVRWRALRLSGLRQPCPGDAQ